MRDYTTIIVGAGSAGAVIAARMTESSDHNVLLIDAGPDYAHPSSLPSDLANGKRNSLVHHDWNYKHRPNDHQHTFRLPRGRVVGGSSAVNTCIALRGCPEDYDEWGDMGMKDWSWDQCLPAFKRLESDMDYKNEWHGNDGPLPLRRHPIDELTPWQSAFLEACDELGYEKCSDHNDPTTTGAGPHAMNKLNGRRISVAEAYLTPSVRARPNLTIMAETTARRVVFYNRQVVGIEVERHGEIETIHCPNVIVSCGSIASPGLLLRSGIGPRLDLDNLAVPVVAVNEGVGSRLWDHPGAAFFLMPKKRGLVKNDDPIIQTVCRYDSGETGFPNDLQIQPGSVITAPRFNIPMVMMMCCVEKPFRHGRIRYTSADPHARPEIHSRLLDDPNDRRMAVDALYRGYELTQSKAMRDLAEPVVPTRFVLKSKAKMDEIIRKICDSGYHPSGTVPMGADDDATAALDGRGRVRGVSGLAVADASIFPTVPSVNINIPTIMVGERFGEWARNGDLFAA